MSSFKRAVLYLISDRMSFMDAIVTRLHFVFSDKAFLSLRFYFHLGKWIDWKNPKTFNEKIQWLKLYGYKPFYTNLVDKLTVKDYVASIIGAEYVIPTLDVWNKVDDIQFDKLPDRFVLKTTHGGGGGGVVICKDKDSFDVKGAKNKLSVALKNSIYRKYRERPYKGVPHRIIAEPFLCESDGSGIKDYKFFCFHGKVKFFKVDFDRQTDHYANYYDVDGSILPFGEAYYPPRFEKKWEKPANLNEMVLLAEKLSDVSPFLRVDLYSVQGKIYFGELTFYPSSGMGRFIPEEWDLNLGHYIDLT